MGRFTIAAKHYQTVAELFETEAADLDKAIQHFETAADYFKGEESNSSANKCLVKVAQYAAQLENYEKAIQIYEQVAAAALESALLKYSAKDYFFRASSVTSVWTVSMLNMLQAGCLVHHSATQG
eukprot:TRINITY_DN13019_c0_g1_i1.p1 TRINITY_DN13019_c0_g1~~TRINITY_DN13019_c0_g1_i1.p1  ORF type:complete len:125 (-),score=53.33 TRINITY_DN13019_c0_g1_i1:157-531(-)